jgi:hypothetical protein
MRMIARILLVLAVLSLPRAASAQREPANKLGARSTLAIDQIAGFRAGAINGPSGALGFTYAGPIGFAHQSYSLNGLGGNNGNGSGNATYSTNTFWLAPSADYFVIDGLSVGGLFEISSVSGSLETQLNSGLSQTTDLATTTNIAFVPRVGYMVALSDRWGIWPRGGLGYASRQAVDPANTNAKLTTSGFLMDIDVGFIYRPTEMVYFRLGPELAFTLGASHSATVGGTTLSANASVFQLALLGGVGVMFDL